MDRFAAVVKLSRDEQGKTPLLEPVLFDPAALWLSSALEREGASRFFVFCHRDDMAAAAPCFPEGTVFACPDTAEGQAALADFTASAGCPVRTFPDAGFDLDAVLGKEASVRRLTAAGVRFIDPQNAWIGPRVEVGDGTVILPGTILRGNTVIGKNCEIGPNTMIRDCRIADGVTVNSSQLNEAEVDEGTTVGPFAYIRPHTHVGKNVKVGDFVELKNSTIGEGTKISHLTYVGDSDVGSKVNFGCGTVTVNYDGTKKYRTVIGDHAFIGCNTNLVAPVEVGEGAYTAAGSTITDTVPPQSLAIARSRQEVKKDWVKRRRKS